MQLGQKPIAQTADSRLPSTQLKPNFINEIDVQYGPAPLLGRFFLEVDRAVRARGISLRFGTFEEFAEVNATNLATWSPLMPLLDHRQCRITAYDGLCVLGEDEHGTVITAQAARLIDLGDRSLKEAAETAEFFYPDKPAEDRSAYYANLSAASADDIYGRIIYSGGTWVRPDYRGRGMASLLPRVSRAIAATRWNAPITISFVTQDLIDRGVPKAYGYTTVEWGLRLSAGDESIYEGALARVSHHR